MSAGTWFGISLVCVGLFLLGMILFGPRRPR